MAWWKRFQSGRAYAGMVKEQQYAAVASAKSVEALDAMWAAWEAVGHSREGLLYASILEQKRQLGAVLEADQVAAIELAAKRQKRGATLPPISGKMKGG